MTMLDKNIEIENVKCENTFLANYLHENLSIFASEKLEIFETLCAHEMEEFLTNNENV